MQRSLIVQLVRGMEGIRDLKLKSVYQRHCLVVYPVRQTVQDGFNFDSQLSEIVCSISSTKSVLWVLYHTSTGKVKFFVHIDLRLLSAVIDPMVIIYGRITYS